MSKSEEEKLGKSCEQVAVQEIKKEVGCSVSKFDQEDDSKEEILLDDLLKSKYDGRTIQLPDFAIVYSFLELFGVFLELPYITMPELEQSIDSTKIFTGGEDIGVLESLHAKLFRKLSKSPRFSILSNFKPSKLSKTVLKFAQMTELPFAWDLEQFGYHILTCAQKLQLLKALCDIQFDENQKFKSILFEAYKADQGASLRLLPFGYEQDGKTVWFHEDGEYNVQVYAGELEENDMWHVRAGNLDDLTEYISILKKLSEVNPKDIAAEKLRLRNAVKQEEKEKRRLERERQRQLQKEEKNDKKKGRKTKVIINTSESEEEDDGCCRCLANNQSDLVLLCDGCDAAYHTLCLRPPVESIPEGDWYCPFCLQVKLIESLGVKLNELSAKIKARERKSKRMVFYGISPANIVDKTSEDIVTRRSGRGAKRIDYNFSEYDELIKEAVNGKDEKESLPSDRVSARNTKQKRQRRKLNDLDSDNEDDFDSGDNSFSNYDSDKRDDIKHFINDHDETEERRQDKHLRRSRRFKTRRKRSNLDEDEEDSNKSDSDSFDSKKPKRRLRQRKITRYDETPFSSENEEPIKSINPEEVDEWIGDEQSSELSESEDLNSEISDSPKQRRILMHRKVKNNVNLCEDDTEDDSEEDEEECGFSEESLDGVNSEKDEQVMESEQVPNTPSEEQSRDNKSGDEKCREITQNAPNVNDQIKPLEHSDIKSIDDMKIVKPLPTTKELKAESNIVSMTFTGVTTSLFSPVIQHANKSFCHPRERFKQVTKSKSPSSSPTKTSDNIHQQQPIIQAVPFSKASSLPLHPREIYNNLLKNKATEIPNLSTQNTSSAFIHHSSSPSTLCQSFSSSSSLGCSTILTPTQNISSNASFHNITSPQDLNASRLQFNNIHGNYFSNSGYEPSYTQSQRFPTPGCLPPQQIGVQAHSYNHGASPSLGFYPIRSTLYSPRQQGQYRPSPAFPNVHSSTGYFMESAVSSPSLYPPPYEYSDHIRPPVHIGVYPYSQYSGVQNVGNQNVKQDREIKKQLKEQAKQERELKKLEKLQEKEKKKQKKVSTVNRGVDGKSNMNFFRNMVISPDNNKEDTNEQFQ